MRDSELVFRDRLDKLIGKYCPNDAVLNTLAFYLFREAADVLRTSSKEGIEAEVQNIQRNQEIELPSFNKAVKDLSAFSAQKMAMEAIKRAFLEVKSSVPMVQRGQAVQSIPVTPKQPVAQAHSGFSQNEAEFDIDLSSIPRVDVSKIRQQVQVRKAPVQTGFASNVFSGDVHINMDEINMRTPRVSSGGDDDDGDDGIPPSDASSYTEGAVYTDVPKVSVDLDY